MLWPVGPNRSVSVSFQEFVGLCGLPHFPMTSRESMTSPISDPRTSFRAEPKKHPETHENSVPFRRVGERDVLEAPAPSENSGRQEPPVQRVPRLEPRNKDINPHRVEYNTTRGVI